MGCLLFLLGNGFPLMRNWLKKRGLLRRFRFHDTGVNESKGSGRQSHDSFYCVYSPRARNFRIKDKVRSQADTEARAVGGGKED
jgi:hypothetical protein